MPTVIVSQILAKPVTGGEPHGLSLFFFKGDVYADSESETVCDCGGSSGDAP